MCMTHGFCIPPSLSISDVKPFALGFGSSILPIGSCKLAELGSPSKPGPRTPYSPTSNNVLPCACRLFRVQISGLAIHPLETRGHAPVSIFHINMPTVSIYLFKSHGRQPPALTPHFHFRAFSEVTPPGRHHCGSLKLRSSLFAAFITPATWFCPLFPWFRGSAKKRYHPLKQRLTARTILPPCVRAQYCRMMQW